MSSPSSRRRDGNDLGHPLNCVSILGGLPDQSQPPQIPPTLGYVTAGIAVAIAIAIGGQPTREGTPEGTPQVPQRVHLALPVSKPTPSAALGNGNPGPPPPPPPPPAHPLTLHNHQGDFGCRGLMARVKPRSNHIPIYLYP